MKVSDFASKVQCFIESNRLFTDSDRLLVGVSGGSDSVGLLCVLVELGYDVTAAHCNFYLRGEESVRDEHFVTSLCDHLGVGCHVVGFETEKYAQDHHLSIEMAARELRYNYFHSLLTEYRYGKICIAHHNDDSIETFFINLLRGSGLRGLCGIPVKNGHVVRPLLGCSREEILSYLSSIGETYVTDSTNLQSLYLRNRVRQELLPLLESINPSARTNLLTSIENLSEANQLYSWCIGRMEEESSFVRDGRLYISKTSLRQSPSPLCLLHETLRDCGFNRDQEVQLLKSIDDPGKLFYSSNYVLTVDRDYFIVDERQDQGFAPEQHTLEGCTGTIRLSDGVAIAYEIVEASSLSIEKDPSYGYFDLAKLGRTIHFRPWHQGDRFRPFGMKGQKLVSDLLTDHKQSRFDKSHQWVVLSGDTIAWVIGIRSSEEFRIDSHTQKVVVMRLVR